MPKIVLLTTLLVSLALADKTWAFPEMIRMGYVNCTSCHTSPSGGGLLTDYGRSTSSEVLSTWAKPQEELFGHGLIPEPPTWLKVGGDLRALQTYVDTPRATATTFFPMQMDFEFGLNFDKFTYVQSIGVQGGPEGAPYKDEVVAHRFYALYNWTDEVYSRAGKYLLPYGIQLPDHTSFVRKNLGFNENQESYNLDVGSIGENWNSLFAVSFGRKDQTRTELETGASFQLSKNIGDSHKILGSFAYLKNQNSHRYLAGPAVLWGFSPKWVFLGEYDYQEKSITGPSPKVEKGAVTYSRLQYEWIKGVNTYLLHQFSYLDFTQLRTRVNSAGLGVLWYPRPHFELAIEFDSIVTAQVDETNNVGWLLLHYYL